MARYDGLIIPRSYSEYINKTDAATLLQALQLSGVMDNAPTANSNKPIKSSGVYNSLNKTTPVFDIPRAGTYTITYITRQNINNGRLYAGLLTAGADATGGNIFLTMDELRGESGWFVIGYWRLLETELSGRIYIATNTSLWIQKGNTTTAGTNDRLTSTEIAGKRLEFFFYAFKV